MWSSRSHALSSAALDPALAAALGVSATVAAFRVFAAGAFLVPVAALCTGIALAGLLAGVTCGLPCRAPLAVGASLAALEDVCSLSLAVAVALNAAVGVAALADAAFA